MKKVVTALVIMNFLCLLGIGYLLMNNSNSKTAYFLSAEVYNSFQYKIELEAELESTYSKQLVQLDSLERQLNIQIEYFRQSNAQPTDDQLANLQYQQNHYINFRDEVELDYAEQIEEKYGLIWGRLNDYVSEFGHENGYNYIFSANGDGSLMYADESQDITSQIIEFVNQKYSGV
jgi:outer membrane protein